MMLFTRKVLDGVRKNRDTVSSFIDITARHNGKLNPSNLFKVMNENGELSVETGKDTSRDIRSVIIGIEPCNSFSPLYELDYFLMGLFLSTVATALPLAEYPRIDDEKARKEKIYRDLSQITETDIELAIRSPKIAMVAILTDDIEPYRYRKDHLWGIDGPAMKKRSIDVCRHDLYHVDRIPLEGLWTEDDALHAYEAIQNSRNLCEAKMIQTYLSIGKFLSALGIDIGVIPLFFSVTPNSDIRNLGVRNPFLDILLELHSPEQYFLLRKLLRWNYPRLIGVSCPECGESSKKVINGQIRGDTKRSVRLTCSEKHKDFRNELGVDTLTRRGCGHHWDLQIPPNPKELYELLKEGFGLYFPVNSLFWVINGLSFAPSALLFTDAGFNKKEGKIVLERDLPIGDHADL